PTSDPPQHLPPFPSRRSSDLKTPNFGTTQAFVGYAENLPANDRTKNRGNYVPRHCPWLAFSDIVESRDTSTFPQTEQGFANLPLDRKSTRLNSSHQIISYAVF